MPAIKCSRCTPRSFYPKQITIVKAGATVYGICPNCLQELYETLRSKQDIYNSINRVATLGDQYRIDCGRGQEYARGEFSFEAES